jgi:tRNA U38,U39,U40 pseudouridine synthase TruA
LHELCVARDRKYEEGKRKMNLSEKDYMDIMNTLDLASDYALEIYENDFIRNMVRDLIRSAMDTLRKASIKNDDMRTL